MSVSNTVLITGATGFIGRATALALLDAGWNVTQGVRLPSGSLMKGCVRLDLSEPSTILVLAKETRFDAIVHLGSLVGLADESEPQMFVPNVLSTGCLAYLAKIWGARLIFASTVIVHGARNEKIESETPVCPDTAYAKSKLSGEQLLAAAQINHCVLRIAGVFGANGPAHLGLNRAIDGAIKGEPPLQVGSGRALRNYIYVKDVAAAIVFTLQEQIGGLHLLAGHEVMSISAMLAAICDVFTPGLTPLTKDGPDAMSQVIHSSVLLPKSRGFHDALIDIRNDLRQ